MKRLYINLGAPLDKRLREYSREADVPMSEVMRNALRFFLDREEGKK